MYCKIIVFVWRQDSLKEMIGDWRSLTVELKCCLNRGWGTALPPEVRLPLLEKPSVYCILLLVQTTADLATLMTARVKTTRIHLARC